MEKEKEDEGRQGLDKEKRRQRILQ